jgi:hypothetical protein
MILQKLIISGLKIDLMMERETQLPPCFIPFSSHHDKADLKIKVSLTLPDSIDEIMDSGKLHKTQFTTYYNYKDSLYTHFNWGGRIILSKYSKKIPNEIFVWTNIPIVDEALLSHICFEQVIINNNGLLMHSSFIKTVEGDGILFLAPSGGGKSTQASLWEKYNNAEIINGDKSAIKIENNNVLAYGLPWAGTSNIYINEKANLRALVFLEKSNDNCAVPINKMEAIKKIINFSYAPIWYSDYLSDILVIADNISEKTNSIIFSCKADKSSAEYLKKYFEGNRNNE